MEQSGNPTQIVLEYHEKIESQQVEEGSFQMPFGNGRTITIAEQINMTLGNSPKWTVQSITPMYNYGGNEDGHLGKSHVIVVFKTE